MAAQTVYVLTYTHKHGEDVTVYSTEHAAKRAAGDIARVYWETAVASDYALPGMRKSPGGMGDEEVTRQYFMVMGNHGESYSITATDVQ